MRRFVIVLAVFLFSTSAFAQPTEATIDKDVRDTIEAWHLPGLAIAVVHNDKIIFLKGYGIKEIGRTQPITADTLFEIGSTTKAFTATAMAMLADEKKLSWDDPVRNYVPGFHVSDPCTDALITLRDIASHRSGLARHDELWDDSDLPREELIRRIGAMKVWRPIRAGYQYNNLMFVTAGEAAASAAKMPWEQLIRTRIFAPLGMTESRIAFAEWPASDHATGHRWISKTRSAAIQPMRNYDALAPAGTIKSSAHDMAQWLRFQLTGGAIDGRRLMSLSAIEETHTPQTIIPIGPASRLLYPDMNFLTYGLGWNISDYHGELLVAHAGALNGFRTNVALLPKRNFGIVILENIGRGSALAALRNTIIDQFLGAAARDWNSDMLDAEKFESAKADDAQREREAKRATAPKPSRELAAFAGTYHNAGFGDATISVVDNALTLHWERLTLPLVHENYDTFSAIDTAEDIDEPVQFRLAADGSVAAFTLFGEEFLRVSASPREKNEQ
ncbi:MAG TPA: serine hydrolase [Thermoanaerobaculia bacterium]|jgi:CubicO group peptidase (beta-lactamase class C family)|nr:serine hydrolase [Thermoanaerobaculia bacterium]